MKTPATITKPTLTATQGRVIECLWAGQSDKEVASALGISVSGARGHLRRLCKKFQCSNTRHLIALTAFALLADSIGNDTVADSTSGGKTQKALK